MMSRKGDGFVTQFGLSLYLCEKKDYPMTWLVLFSYDLNNIGYAFGIWLY